jgi:ribosome-binding factor A
MKDPNRPRRVAELLKRELAILIPREWDDPAAHQLTLTGAEVTPDLSQARVYFSLLAGASKAPQVAKSLNHAAGFFRHELRHRVGGKRGVPELRFYFDASLEEGDKIDRLIDRALTEDKQHPHD